MNAVISQDRISEISAALTGARKAGLALPGFPGALPETLDECYAVQRHSAAVWARDCNDEIGGWKVGGVPAAYIEQFNETRLTGPVWKRNIFYAENGSETPMAVFPGFAAVEGEWVFRMGDTLETDTLHIGIEVASSPLPAINDIGPVAVICDFGNNNGLIVGPEIKNWRDIDPGKIHLETEIDGEIVGTKDVTNFPKDGLAGLAFLRAHAEKHGIAMPAGTFCTSGAITGVHESRVGERAICHFGKFGSLGLEFVASGGTCA